MCYPHCGCGGRFLHQPYFRRCSEQFPQRLEPPLAERAELTGMQRCDGTLHPVEQPASLARDPTGYDPAVRTVPRSARQSALFEPVEEPGYVGVTSRGSLSYCRQRCAGGPGVLEDAQHVILLRRDAGRPQQRRELMNQLARQVLKQQVDLALQRLRRFEPPRAPCGVLVLCQHGRVRWKTVFNIIVEIRIFVTTPIVNPVTGARAA